MKRTVTQLRCWVWMMVVGGLLLALPARSPLHAQAGPPAGSSQVANPVAVAQELYRQAFFDEAVQSLKVAFATGRVTPDEWAKANEWLARALVRSGNRIGARAVFFEILERDGQYRPDALRIPQDEVDVFNLALADYRVNEARQMRRIPVSFGFQVGRGSADNSDFAALAQTKGGDGHFKGETEFAGSIRFPLPIRAGGWSLDVELGRFRGTDFDNLPTGNDAKVSYEASAMPLTISLLRAFPFRAGRLNLFGGGGPLLASEINMRFLHNHNLTELIPVTLNGRATGTIAQLGGELEFPVQKRLTVAARGVYRRAATGKIDFARPNFLLYDPDPATKIGGRSLDFSGFAASVGLRAQVGF